MKQHACVYQKYILLYLYTANLCSALEIITMNPGNT